MEWTDLSFFTSRQDVAMSQFVQREIASGKSVLPSEDLIYNALAHTPLESVKVMILGQDPYINRDQAMGLAFSIPNECKNYPGSLVNIFQELRDDLGIQRTNGNLIGWAHQGVLLLNSALTVVEGVSKSHKSKGWEELIKEVIKYLNDTKEHIVFIMWGSDAQTLGKKINTTKHLTLSAIHPSPLSYNSIPKTNPKHFSGSKPFSKANAYLRLHNKTEIDWSQ